jgi:hypothetical protein
LTNLQTPIADFAKKHAFDSGIAQKFALIFSKNAIFRKNSSELSIATDSKASRKQAAEEKNCASHTISIWAARRFGTAEMGL